MKSFKRFIPIAIIIAVTIAAYFFGVGEYISIENFKRHRVFLLKLVDAHAIMAPLLYIALYTLSTALSIPGGALLTIFGGFLFGQPYSVIYVVIGATLGAIVIFLSARTALGETLSKKASGPRMTKIKNGIKENAVSYLLFLRLVPLFPFWLVNIAPALLNISLWTFSWTTFVGIIPGTFAFSQAGTGLGSILDSNEPFSVQGFFTTEMKIAIIALAIFALIPIVVKKLRKGKKV
ncbi:MAG: TVP38/TMEM64 family protein [Waddliaceae bacterium]|jgi:uncharacterized membrane protein YdjX (TVP38/TMEM64 family)|nr:TVP38/TMEM64 family protein [Waddliaceae bacterium]MBT3578758.1 TVP38/TMEM64 family protein [Waddliaceae bacterium]MBT4444406.1 TVP38/TMEM64 family protein [Waddliaceae bacterium]MBT6927882.1 TVP38/TMEM64 family protein [Waddliaceae bacterium]MBT7265216.1 TVP38/TMEM64 family protein [Waddliaceae bacterium]